MPSDTATNSALTKANEKRRVGLALTVLRASGYSDARIAADLDCTTRSIDRWRSGQYCPQMAFRMRLFQLARRDASELAQNKQ